MGSMGWAPDPSAPLQRQPFTIRPATKNDIPGICRIGSAVFAATFGYSLSKEDLAQYLIDAYSTESITKDFGTGNSDFIVAESNEASHEVLGFGMLTRGSTEPCLHHLDQVVLVELQRLYVSQSAQGMGVGKGLMQEMETMARAQAFTKMWLGVWEDNHVAQKVYGKGGYKKVGTHDFVMGEEVQTDWIMVREL